MKKFLFFAAAMLCLVACNKNNENNPTAPARKVTLHATVENGDAANGPHRVAPVDLTASPVTFVWQADDQVIVKTNAGFYTLDATNIEGNLADFEGEVAGSLDNYTALYGYDPDATTQTIEYVAGSFKPCVYGEGHNDNFTLDQFFPVLKLQLTGASTLGKIEYLIGTDVKATMTITGGIALTSTASVVYLPVADVASTGFSLKFYDNAATPALIMEKATTFDLSDKMGKIVTMPELEVQAGSATTGTAKRTGNIDVTWVQLWANGPKFANYNVGVTDGKEESYGGYYTWGGTYENGTGNAWYDDHNTSLDVTITGDDDTATALWGSNWRMPTKSEFDGLLSNCDVEFISDYKETGVKGLLCTGKNGYATNSVFFPCAGMCMEEGGVSGMNKGIYWSSYSGGGANVNAYYLKFDASSHRTLSSSRTNGYPVRAVLVE